MNFRRGSAAVRWQRTGGAGHTTETLRQRVHAEYQAIETANLPEAEVFQRYLRTVHGCEADYLETASTNCGNNISYLRDLLHAHGVPCRSLVLTQDATMQCRMAAGLAKMAPDIRCLNYAALQPVYGTRAANPAFASR